MHGTKTESWDNDPYISLRKRSTENLETMPSVELEAVFWKSYTDFILAIVLTSVSKKAEWEEKKKNMQAIEKGHAKEI